MGERPHIEPEQSAAAPPVRRRVLGARGPPWAECDASRRAQRGGSRVFIWSRRAQRGGESSEEPQATMGGDGEKRRM